MGASRTPLGQWVAVGMARIAREIERCVFFLFGQNPQTGALVGPGATGFFVARQSDVLDRTFHVYAVSNRHAVQKYYSIRINKSQDETRMIELDPAEWIWSDTDDLAAVDVTDFLSFDCETYAFIDDITWVDESSFVTHAKIFYRDIGIGDQTVMLGLFADHSGGQKNLPVGRFGLIAAMPDDAMPVRLGLDDTIERPAFLNDMRSRSGFSGSPVWIWRTPYDDMNQVGFNGRAQMFHPMNAFLALAGVHRGQFREQTTLRLVEERALRTGDDIEIASAMTIVIPAWEITTLLDKETFKRQRTERDGRPERIKLSQALSFS